MVNFFDFCEYTRYPGPTTYRFFSKITLWLSSIPYYPFNPNIKFFVELGVFIFYSLENKKTKQSLLFSLE